MSIDWTGKTVVVTGAASGLGRALCDELAQRGAVVYVTALTLAESRAVADALVDKGYEAHAAELDVNDRAAFRTVLNRVSEAHGRLDALINNAALLYVGEFYEMSEAGIERMVQTNVTSVAVGCLHAYRLMKKQGHGLVLNISSMAGFAPTPTMAAYAATKHALIGLTHSLDCEARQFGVRVRAACLGLVDTPLFRHAEIARGDEATVNAMLPVEAIPAPEAARRIIDGLDGSGRIVFVPFYARLSWWINRFLPSLLFRNAPATLRRYRALARSADVAESPDY